MMCWYWRFGSSAPPQRACHSLRGGTCCVVSLRMRYFDSVGSISVHDKFRLIAQSNVYLARAVSEAITMNAQFFQHAQEQVGHRRVRRRHDMTISLQLARGASDEHDWQRVMIVLVTITHTAAVEDHRVIQQCPIAI